MNLTPAVKKVLYVAKDARELKFLDERKTKNLLDYIICPCLCGDLVEDSFCSVLRRGEIIEGDYCESAKNILECEFLRELTQNPSEEVLKTKFNKYDKDLALQFYNGLNLINEYMKKK